MSLEIFTPTARAITIAGTDFEILPLRMKQVAGFSEAIRPVQALLLAGKLTEATQHHFDNIIRAVSIGSGAEEDWLSDLYPHEFMALADLVFEVNVDFFVRHVLPKVRVAAQSVTSAIPASPGEPCLPGSSDADTPLTPP